MTRARLAVLALLLLPGAAGAGTDPGLETGRRLSMEVEGQAEGLAVLPHKPTYILPYSYSTHPNEPPFALQTGGRPQQKAEIKYQISFRIPLWRKIFGYPLHLYGGYTQLSFWQAYNAKASAPIRNTDYEPEAILALGTRTPVLGFTNRAVLLGVVHQSNGQTATQALSRSWARVYAQFLLHRGRLVLALRPWWRVPEKHDDNPEISKFLGHGDVRLHWRPGRNAFSLLWRNNLRGSHNRGAVELAWSFPCVNQVRWYVQYWNGYGENLLDYDRPTQRVGAGILLGEWF